MLHTLTIPRKGHPEKRPLCCWTRYVGTLSPMGGRQEPKYAPPPTLLQQGWRTARNPTIASVPVGDVATWTDMVQRCVKHVLVGVRWHNPGVPGTWTWGIHCPESARTMSGL